ncbi:uncharacterized protein BCR38DRAFT_494259 [Pseudomassariella vexata]|uniref:Short-chain dehydrogenase n=1 Tax=Pseudomassariella vexata TaxID=1141098 RepID=A0A1Y2EKZ7_9PEZI|nr:uncharacterized protein BCR38DRAFT_494259 [Pseudomassariella vexata]ORY72188.1 hypothetical protein BCR38DRAFT_494259 [Pseudomassariella vexata]
MPEFNGTTTQDEVIAAFGSCAKGRTFVITGAGQPSIGSQMATALAKVEPGHILIASRSFSKVEPVIKSIEATNKSIKTSFVQVDLSDHISVRQAAAKILQAAPAINVLINSAGNMAINEYTLDKQGIEIQLSVNHVGHFLLINLLVPGLLAGAAESTAGARVVNLTSGGYLVSPVRAYQRWKAYGQAKTANILFSFGLTRRLRSRGITSTAAHPGYNSDTELAKHLTWADFDEIEPTSKANTGKEFVWEEPRIKAFDQIAATPLIAALDPDLPAKSPAYLQNSCVTPCDETASSSENADKLWKLSEKLVGQEFSH